MNWVDIAIIIVGIIFIVIGLKQGLIRTVFSIAGLAGGIALAGRYHEPFAAVLSPGGASWAGIAAFAIIVIITLVVANLVGMLVKRAANILLLGWIDKVFGGILGAIIGLVLCAALLTIVSKFFPDLGQDVIGQSAVAKVVMEQFPMLLGLLPEDFDFIRDFFQQNGELPLDKLTEILP